MKPTFAATLLLAGSLLLAGCQADKTAAICKNKPAALKTTNQAVTDLKIEDVRVGKGAEALPGKTVKVHYIGRLVDGKEFDSSCQEGREAFEFTLGQGQVIPGWDSGVLGMKVGGYRRLIIPARLAYGERSPSPDIPANSALIFDVELMEVK
ncbi:FKBP-type peptidyl-prolyl cis-trans isomerase [Calidithermus timidus]|uniref:FKBP-type peptidyl-prolyl cis-trans isomerase n=1 Tax=Calidithermus timidus TaxID=307124 RepID=UPI0003607B0A|nr:FKBP-type peptidyl-prolyl cis-trans isomerase [Calidithermus timidus]